MVPSRILAVALTAFAALFAAVAAAQTYPVKPVRLIVTYPPGGSSDLMARVFGLKLGELWSQQVLVESKGGAAGAIGMEYAARQAPDGYSFVIGNLGPTAVNPLLSKVPYSVDRDFIPVSLISTGPNILVVNANSEFKSLGELLAYARANPGKLNYGTSGPGSVSHLGAELFKSLTKANVVEVPYKGSILAIQDLLGGQIQFIFSDALPALSHIRGGKLRALAVTSPERSALVPDLPTCVEAGVPGLVAVNWWGVLMPAGTPKPIIDKFHGDLVKTMADPEVKRKFGDLGVDAISSSPEQFASFIKSETAKYEKLIKEAGIKVQ
jgi:tripartite-type tricarboxylate transporter receptor subunit TctC